MDENIILIGFMGCGKSSLGEKLSRAFSYQRLDTDEQIEQRAGRKIDEIFKEQGEAVFRDMETALLCTLQNNRKKTVISVGGGLPVKEENRALLKQLGCVVWLQAEPDTIYERLKEDTTRPLLQVPDPKAKIKELLEQRYPCYVSAADYVIKTEFRSCYSIIREIELIMRRRKKKSKKERKNKMALKKKIMVLNGPNINFLGKREPEIYGTDTYEDLCKLLKQKADSLNLGLECYQSNLEGELIDRIQDACQFKVDGIIINPAAYTHYSYAIHDALLSFQGPVVEVHISNIHKREEFRRTSVTAPACSGQIAGLGFQGYLLAMEYIFQKIQ